MIILILDHNKENIDPKKKKKKESNKNQLDDKSKLEVKYNEFNNPLQNSLTFNHKSSLKENQLLYPSKNSLNINKKPLLFKENEVSKYYYNELDQYDKPYSVQINRNSFHLISTHEKQDITPTHTISIRFPANEPSTLKYIFDVQDIQSKLMKVTKNCGNVGEPEKAECLHINLVFLRINEYEKNIVEEAIERVFSRFQNSLFFKGGFILNFKNVYYNPKAKTLYLKPHINKDKLIYLQKALQDELGYYCTHTNLDMHITIFRGTKFGNCNLVELYKLNQDILSIAFTCKSINLTKIKPTKYDLYVTSTKFNLIGTCPN